MDRHSRFGRCGDGAVPKSEGLTVAESRNRCNSLTCAWHLFERRPRHRSGKLQRQELSLLGPLERHLFQHSYRKSMHLPNYCILVDRFVLCLNRLETPRTGATPILAFVESTQQKNATTPWTDWLTCCTQLDYIQLAGPSWHRYLDTNCSLWKLSGLACVCVASCLVPNGTPLSHCLVLILVPHLS
jgi:hypothetical protein